MHQHDTPQGAVPPVSSEVREDYVEYVEGSPEVVISSMASWLTSLDRQVPSSTKRPYKGPFIEL